MTKVFATTPTGDIDLIGENIDIQKAAELAVVYVHKYDLHHDGIDINYIDESGKNHDFDFETELFKS